MLNALHETFAKCFFNAETQIEFGSSSSSPPFLLLYCYILQHITASASMSNTYTNTCLCLLRMGE